MSTSTRKLVTDKSGIRDVRGYTTDNQTSTRKLVRDSEPVDDEKPKFEIDLRVEGVPQDAIRIDLKKKGDIIFSEESSRAIYEMGNLELIELRQASATVQCLSCLKHVPEGLNMFLCGFWLRPNQDTMNRIKARFEASTAPYYRATFQSRGRKNGHNQWRKDHGRAVDAKRGAMKRGDHPSILSRWQNDEIYRASQVAIGWTETYVKYLDSTTSPRLTSSTTRLTAKEIGMKT